MHDLVLQLSISQCLIVSDSCIQGSPSCRELSKGGAGSSLVTESHFFLHASYQNQGWVKG